jgi:hypothetical protein
MNSTDQTHAGRDLVGCTKASTSGQIVSNGGMKPSQGAVQVCIFARTLYLVLIRAHIYLHIH